MENIHNQPNNLQEAGGSLDKQEKGVFDTLKNIAGAGILGVAGAVASVPAQAVEQNQDLNPQTSLSQEATYNFSTPDVSSFSSHAYTNPTYSDYKYTSPTYSIPEDPETIMVPDSPESTIHTYAESEKIPVSPAVRENLSSVEGALNTKFATSLLQNGYKNIVLNPAFSQNEGLFGLAVLIEGDNIKHTAYVEGQKSIFENKYALEALVSSAVEKELGSK